METSLQHEKIVMICGDEQKCGCFLVSGRECLRWRRFGLRAIEICFTLPTEGAAQEG